MTHTINQIINPASLDALKAHLSLYGLGDIALLLDDTTIEEDGKINIVANLLPNTAVFTCYLVKNTENDFLFFLQSSPATQQFADYFPEILPYNPWGVVDTDAYPFPNLAAVNINELTWQYLYCSTTVQDTQKQLCLLSDSTKLLNLDNLKAISGSEISLFDEKLLWQGGFYYKGSFNVPWQTIMPDNLRVIYTPPDVSTSVRGAIVQKEGFSTIKLQIPLLEVAQPFDCEAIKKMELMLELSTALTAESDSYSLFPKSKARRIGLAGNMQLGDNAADLSIAGSWPLDEDDILISTTCQLHDIQQYFDNSSIEGLSLPENAEIDLVLEISKENASVDKISFDLTLDKWEIVQDNFSIDTVNFGIRIYNPGSLNLLLASFEAKLRLGENVVLACTGNYPEGNFSLALDPQTTIKVKDLLSVFLDNHGFETDSEITIFSGSYNYTTKYVSFQLAIAQIDKWKTGTQAADIGFRLQNINIAVYGFTGKYRFILKAAFSYTFTNKKLSAKTLLFQGGAEYNEGWIFSADYKGEITLQDIATEFGFDSVPNELANFSFTALSFLILGASQNKFFSGSCTIDLYGQEIDLSLTANVSPEGSAFSGKFSTEFCDKPTLFLVDFKKKATGYDLDLQLLFTVAGITIELEAHKEEKAATGETKALSDLTFSGGTQGLNLPITDLLAGLLENINLADLVPVELLPEINVSDVFVLYDGKKKETSLIASAIIEGKEIQVFYKSQAKKDTFSKPIYLFGIQTDVASFGDLPFVGPQLTEVSLTGVGFIYTSEAGKFNLPTLSNSSQETLRKIVVATETEEYEKGFCLLGAIHLPSSNPFPLHLPLTKSSETQPNNNKDATNKEIASFEPGISYFKVNKNIGPITLGKVGFKLEGTQLSLLIGASLSLAGLKISLEGLGFSFSLPKLLKGDLEVPTFSLSGLGVAYNKPPLQVSGMFLRAEPKEGEKISFYGLAEIKTPSFGISAMGGYALREDNQSSFFVYGMYDAPIGGPAFFFVTGIAAGFGFNRKVRIPAIEQVRDFPLVAMALNPDPNKDTLAILSELNTGNWIPSSPGDYWLAVGIRFTSFKLFDSFVLLTAQFGTKTEFAIIGLSVLQWPNKDSPIAYIELAVLAKFGPDSEVIAVDARLTNNSYIFDKNCKLTGGFAFYVWVSGEHEGDFVISLGGYHPKYIVPAHYPKVERLALNWKLSDILSVHGELYYALTPTCIMAGGRWEVLFDIGFLKASLTLWADMMIAWAPFHYEISAGITVRIEADIDFGLFSVSFSVSMGAELHIWGPPFAGEAYVDWSIFSFTIPFGDGDRKEPQALDWEDFKTSFVPKKEANTASREVVDPTENPLNTRINTGIINTRKNADGEIEETFVNPYDVSLGIDSFFPLIEVSKDAIPLDEGTFMTIAGLDSPTYLRNRNTKVGVKSMKKSKLDSLLGFSLTHEGKHVENISLIANAKGVPNALWAVSEADTADSVIKNVLTGMELHVTEPQDDTILTVVLEREEVPIRRTINYLENSEAGGQKTAEAIDAEIAGKLNPSVWADLCSLGFDLALPDTLVYADLNIQTPSYLAGIGQKIPSIITN